MCRLCAEALAGRGETWRWMSAAALGDRVLAS